MPSNFEFDVANTMLDAADARIAALEARCRELAAALRVGISVVNGEYSAPHCDDWIRTTRNLLVPNAGLTAETKGKQP